MVCCQLCMIILARSCADSLLHIGIPPSSDRWHQGDDHMFNQEMTKTPPHPAPLILHELAAKGKKINYINSPFIYLFSALANSFFLFIFVFISDVLYLLHLLWIVISYCCCCFIIRRKCNLSDITGTGRKSTFGLLYCKSFVHIGRLFDSVV